MMAAVTLRRCARVCFARSRAAVTLRRCARVCFARSRTPRVGRRRRQDVRPDARQLGMNDRDSILTALRAQVNLVTGHRPASSSLTPCDGASSSSPAPGDNTRRVTAAPVVSPASIGSADSTRANTAAVQTGHHALAWARRWTAGRRDDATRGGCVLAAAAARMRGRAAAAIASEQSTPSRSELKRSATLQRGARQRSDAMYRRFSRHKRSVLVPFRWGLVLSG